MAESETGGGGSQGPASRPGPEETIVGPAHAPGLTAAPSVPRQDLSAEKILAHAPRTQLPDGASVPVLAGIPILAKLGQGGMGAVYYGLHPRLEVEVAVKVLPLQTAATQPDSVQRFFREARLAARVKSPHLVSVLDVNEEQGLFFLVMEFVHGSSASSLMNQRVAEGKKGLEEAEALELCCAAASGLAAAHAQNIIHRDVKPDNLLVPVGSSGAPLFGQAKLADLGLARPEQAETGVTVAQTAMGTPGYMAPEQSQDAKTAGKAADVFSLGATLFALLTGQPPFTGPSLLKILMNTTDSPHPPIRKLRPDVSEKTAALLDRCLAKRPEDRFSDARSLLPALEECLAQFPGVSWSATSAPAAQVSSAAPAGRRAWWKIAAPAAAVLLLTAGIFLVRPALKRRNDKTAVLSALDRAQRLLEKDEPEAAGQLLAQTCREVAEDTPGLEGLRGKLAEAQRLAAEKRARTRFLEFIQRLFADDIPGALGYVDPECAQRIGTPHLQRRFEALHQEFRNLGLTPETLRVRDVNLSSDGLRAEVTPEARTSVGEWRPHKLSQWRLVDGEWRLFIEAPRVESIKALKQRCQAFFGHVLRQEWDRAAAFVDPEAHRRHGVGGVRLGLGIVRTLFAIGGIKPDAYRVGEIIIAPDGMRAEVFLELLHPNGEWKAQPKPSLWRYLDGEWYVLTGPPSEPPPGPQPKKKLP